MKTFCFSWLLVPTGRWSKGPPQPISAPHSRAERTIAASAGMDTQPRSGGYKGITDRLVRSIYELLYNNKRLYILLYDLQYDEIKNRKRSEL